MLTNSAPAGLGDIWPKRIVKCYNRTGATLKKGHAAMLDILGTQAETTSTDPTATEGASIYHNVTPCATAGLQTFPILIADEEIADNAIGKFVVSGLCEAAIADDDVGTTDPNRGGALTVLNARPTYVEGQANGQRCMGLLVDADAAADSTVTARTVDTSSHLRWVLWTGGIPCFGNNVDA